MTKSSRYNISILAELLPTVDSPRLWTLCGLNGEPDFFRLLRRDLPLDSTTAGGIDLFTTLVAATDWIDQTKEDGVLALSARELSTTELLECLSRADVVAIDTRMFALTKRGAAALEQIDLFTPQELLAALAGTPMT